MKLYVDVDSRMVRAAAVGLPLEEIALTRGAAHDVEIRFVQDGVVVDPGGSPSVYVALKTYGQYDEDPALYTSAALSKTGTGTSTKWAGVVSLASITALEAAFAEPDEDELPEGGGEPRSVPAMLEIVRVESTVVRTSRLVAVTIENGVY